MRLTYRQAVAVETANLQANAVKVAPLRRQSRVINACWPGASARCRWTPRVARSRRTTPVT